MIGSIKNWVRLKLSSLWKAKARFDGAWVEETAVLNGKPNFRLVKGSKLSLGEGVVLNSYGRSNPLYCQQPVSITTLSPDAKILIAKGVGMSSCSLSAVSLISIGENTLIGAGSLIFDNDFHIRDGENWRSPRTEESHPVVIGKRVFIGARAIILKGVEIGNDAIIGAGAVVTESIPANAIAVGNPAKVLKIKPNRQDFEKNQK